MVMDKGIHIHRHLEMADSGLTRIFVFCVFGIWLCCFAGSHSLVGLLSGKPRGNPRVLKRTHGNGEENPFKANGTPPPSQLVETQGGSMRDHCLVGKPKDNQNGKRF